VELAATVAAARTKDIAGEALAVDANENWFVGLDFSFDEGKMFLAGVELAGVEGESKFPEVCWKFNVLYFLNEFFFASPVFDQRFDGSNFQVVLFGKGLKFGKAGHGTVFVENFTNNPGGVEAREAGQVDRCFGMTGAPENSSGVSLERENVSGAHKVLRFGKGIGEDGNGLGPICGTDSSGNSLGRIDGDGEVCPLRFVIALHHKRETESVRRIGQDGCADKATSMGGHEVDDLRRDFLGGTDQVAFVFAIFVIYNDDDFSFADVGDEFFGRAEVHGSLDVVFVVRVKFGDGNVEDFEVAADGAVLAAGLNEDSSSGKQFVPFVVEFDMTFSFEHIVDFGHALVVVRFTVEFDVDEVHGRDVIFVVHECAAGLTAGTGRWLDLGESSDLKIGSDDFGSDVAHGENVVTMTGLEKGSFCLVRGSFLDLLRLRSMRHTGDGYNNLW